MNFAIQRERVIGRRYARYGAAAAIEHVSHSSLRRLFVWKTLDVSEPLTAVQRVCRYVDMRDLIAKHDAAFRRELPVRIKGGMEWLDAKIAERRVPVVVEKPELARAVVSIGKRAAR